MQRLGQLFFVLLLSAVGCSYQQGTRVGDPPPPAEVQPQFVAVLSEGVTIYAEDGSWSIAADDDPLPPPFRTDSLRLTLAPEGGPSGAVAPATATQDPRMQQVMLKIDQDPNLTPEQRQQLKQQLKQMLAMQQQQQGQGKTQLVVVGGAQGWAQGGAPGGDVLRVPGKHVSLDALLDMSGEFLSAGGQRVRVLVPGREKALYGVLALTPAIKATSESSAKRAYRIMVPEVRVQQALGAQIALVCQPYKAPVPVVKGMTVRTTEAFASNKTMVNEYHDSAEFECVTWILWISDAPFADHDIHWVPPR